MAATRAATYDKSTVSLTCVPTSRRVWKALSRHWRDLLQSMHDGDSFRFPVSGFKLEILSLLCEINEKAQFSASEASAQLQVHPRQLTPFLPFLFLSGTSLVTMFQVHPRHSLEKNAAIDYGAG